MDKLAIYFLSQDARRVLDVAQQPVRKGNGGGMVQGWTIGRLPTCDIAWSPARNPNYAMVSKRHALIYAEPSQDITEGGTVLYHWFLVDKGQSGKGSSNGTHLSQGGKAPYRLQPGIPYQIEEGDRVQFGCSAASIKLSFDIDETKGQGDDDPGTGIHKRKESEAQTTATEATGRTLADVAAIILTGPDGLDKRLWWLLLAAIAAVYIYVRHQ